MSDPLARLTAALADRYLIGRESEQGGPALMAERRFGGSRKDAKIGKGGMMGSGAGVRTVDPPCRPPHPAIGYRSLQGCLTAR